MCQAEEGGAQGEEHAGQSEQSVCSLHLCLTFSFSVGSGEVLFCADASGKHFRIRSLLWLYHHLGSGTEGEKRGIRDVFLKLWKKSWSMSFYLWGGWRLRLGWHVVLTMLLPADGEPATATTVLSPSLIVENTLLKSFARGTALSKVLTLNFQSTGYLCSIF